MEKRTIIEGYDLSIGYRTGKQENQIHEHLHFSLYAGELTCLLGANGTGKSTLLRTLSATQPPLGGELLLMNRPLSNYTEKERSRMIGVVLTDKTFTGGLTVYELVALGRQPHTGFFGRLQKEDKRIIEEALEQTGIAHKARHYTAELSDGERQKAMIAKALVQECPLILLDEPTAFLDVVSRIEIMTLLRRLAVEQQKGILLSTHDIEQAILLSDRLWILSREKGLQCGVTEDLILSHTMDSLFPEHKNIRFDITQGIYASNICGNKQIHLEAENETLRHWAVNALARYGFCCISSPCECSLRAVSPTELVLTQKGETQVYSSFEKLLLCFRNT